MSLGGSALFVFLSTRPFEPWAQKRKDKLMENKEKNETQSRREFFKEAARKALPILGVVALMSNPMLAKAVESEPMGCEKGTCNAGCYNGCHKSCLSNCAIGCEGSSHSVGYNCDGCKGRCMGGCTGGCSGTCSGSCSRSSYAL